MEQASAVGQAVESAVKEGIGTVVEVVNYALADGTVSVSQHVLGGVPPADLARACLGAGRRPPHAMWTAECSMSLLPSMTLQPYSEYVSTHVVQKCPVLSAAGQPPRCGCLCLPAWQGLA